MNSKYVKFFVGGAVFLIILVWYFARAETESSVEVLVTPERGPFEVAVTATGELQAKNSIQIYGPQNARLARIWQMKISKLVPEGTVVDSGDFVAELDKSEITNNIKDVQMEIQKAESRYTQTKLDTALTLSQARDDLINLEYRMEEMKLKKEQSVFEAPSVQRQAEIDYEKAVRAYAQAKRNYKTKVQQAIAQMKEVEADLNQYKQRQNIYNQVLAQFTINAPADGMVIYDKEYNGRKKVVGSTISAWDPVVATLPDLSEMESVTYISEVDIQKIQRGQPVEIGLDADPEKQLTGEVTDIANIGEQRPNSDSKVFEVKITVNESDSTLRPAMTTSNRIVADTMANAIYLPLECIHAEDSVTFVYKKSGGQVTRQEVELGLINENEAVILQGVKEKDKIYLSLPPEIPTTAIRRLPDVTETA